MNSDELIPRKGLRGSSGAQSVPCAAARGGCVFLIHLPAALPFPSLAGSPKGAVPMAGQK